MGIACNTLVAVGGAPDFVSHVPEYPTQLPHHVHKGLEVGLAPLSRDLLLTTFMAIEEPEVQQAEDPDFTPSGTVLIGQFYDELFAAIEAQNPAMSVAGQIDLQSFGGPSWIVSTVEDVRAGIDLIKRQGEGSAAGPFENASDPDELAHFYQFGEIYHGRRLTRTAPFTYTGPEVTMPGVRGGPPTAASVPGAAAFDQTYSDMLRQLQSAWTGGGSDPFDQAVNTMRASLRGLAEPLFAAGGGPGFRLVGAAGEPVVTPVPSAGRFRDVTAILDAAVGPSTFAAHGPFWRGLTRDEFVGTVVFGQDLLVVGKGSESNLVKSLRGQAPFGSDIGTPDADFDRMPAGRDPVPGPGIDLIERWIDDGCPDEPLAGDDTEVSLSTGGFRPDPVVHVEYFRDLDNWSAFHRTPEVEAAINVVFGGFPSWKKHFRDATSDQAWTDEISQPGFTGALTLLSTLQRRTVEAHYGVPVPLLAVLDGYERFGNDGLPADPLRPDDPHRMNGAGMWFMYSSFADACVRLGIAPNFWRFMMRALLCGLCNDGLFRPNRFTVEGFTADAQGRQDVFEHAQTVDDADLPAELGRRYRESRLPGSSP